MQELLTQEMPQLRKMHSAAVGAAVVVHFAEEHQLHPLLTR